MRVNLHFNEYVVLAVTMLLAACQSDICQVNGTIALHDGAKLLIAPCVTDSTLSGDSLFYAPAPPVDSIVVADGSFQWKILVDSAQLYRIWPSHNPQRCATFFSEPGNVRISFDSTAVRVSGTYLNDQWQALNDTVVDYAQRIERTVSTLIAAGTPPSLVNHRVTLHYDELEKIIASTAERNKNNELGRFINYRHPIGSLNKK